MTSSLDVPAGHDIGHDIGRGFGRAWHFPGRPGLMGPNQTRAARHMLYRILADAVVAAHFAFVLFVLLGGFLVLRWRWLAWIHVPIALWGAGIEIIGWPCPLTGFENHLRLRAGQEGYAGGFVEHYILPLIYPDLLFPGGFPRIGFTLIGIAVLAVNAAAYVWVWRTRGRGRRGPGARPRGSGT